MRRSDWTPHRAVDSETLCAEFGVLHVIIWSVPKEVDAFGTKGCVTESNAWERQKGDDSHPELCRGQR